MYEKPKPYEHVQGWQMDDKGVLEPLWCIGPVLPPTLVDLLESGDLLEEAENEDSDGDDDELDLDEMLEFIVDE